MFSYAPKDIEDLYNDVCRNTYDYITGHRFLSKYNIDNIVEMLLKSSSMHCFRSTNEIILC